MASNQEWIARLRRQVNPNHSEAADYWDSLSEAWRGVVLHAASICGTSTLGPHLARCTWKELYARVDSRGMAQLRLGIQQSRNVFEGFGSLRRTDFARRTTDREISQHQPANVGHEMVIDPGTAALLACRKQLLKQEHQ